VFVSSPVLLSRRFASFDRHSRLSFLPNRDKRYVCIQFKSRWSWQQFDDCHQNHPSIHLSQFSALNSAHLWSDCQFPHLFCTCVHEYHWIIKKFKFISWCELWESSE
jgi:hypothetical protein